MSGYPSLWFILNILSIAMLAFYSMSEMACVSFNKVRLQYYVSKGNKQAEWLNWLLHNPTRLFGTTLIGVNLATFFGSEFAREFNRSIGLDPDLSPITQVILVVVFGELAPMFAARRYAEHVAMLSVPLLYFSSQLLAPFIWAISGITKVCSWIIGTPTTDTNIFLSQDELQKILEGDEERASDSEDFNAFTANLFSLRNKEARELMEPIKDLVTVPSNATVGQVINVLRRSEQDYIVIYHRDHTNIVGLASVCDLVRAPENRRVRDYCRPPWFVTQTTSLIQILNQFMRTHELLGIILNKDGRAEGFIRLDDIVEKILGVETTSKPPKTFIERTLPGDMKVEEFNEQFDLILDKDGNLTLSELVIRELGHHPEVGESVFIDPFVLTVEETGLLGIKNIHVSTVLK